MKIIYQKNFKKPLIKINNIFNGELLWLRDIQYKDSRFDKWKKSLNLFTDNQGVIRSRSRLPDTEKFEFDQRHLVLLPSSNYFTKLLILYTHDKVCHAYVESTLTELRLKYWTIKGRQTVRKIINPCVTCKKVQGKVLRPPPTPALPEYRVCAEFPFQVTGFDFAGPLFVKDIYSKSSDVNKCFIMVFTCAASLFTYLELSPDMASVSFTNCFKRFISRCGTPAKVVSNNFKSFKLKETETLNKLMLHGNQYRKITMVGWFLRNAYGDIKISFTKNCRIR